MGSTFEGLRFLGALDLHVARDVSVSTLAFVDRFVTVTYPSIPIPWIISFLLTWLMMRRWCCLRFRAQDSTGCVRSPKPAASRTPTAQTLQQTKLKP